MYELMTKVNILFIGSYFIALPIGFHDFIFKRTAFYIYGQENACGMSSNCLHLIVYVCVYCVNDTIIASTSPIRILFALSHLSHR